MFDLSFFVKLILVLPSQTFFSCFVSYFCFTCDAMVFVVHLYVLGAIHHPVPQPTRGQVWSSQPHLCLHCPGLEKLPAWHFGCQGRFSLHYLCLYNWVLMLHCKNKCDFVDVSEDSCKKRANFSKKEKAASHIQRTEYPEHWTRMCICKTEPAVCVGCEMLTYSCQPATCQWSTDPTPLPWPFTA